MRVLLAREAGRGDNVWEGSAVHAVGPAARYGFTIRARRAGTAGATGAHYLLVLGAGVGLLLLPQLTTHTRALIAMA